MNSFKALIEICESEIRAGLGANASMRLREVNGAQVPRELRLPIANLCRRVGLISVGLKVLSPIVRPTGKHVRVNPTPNELAEYAVLLHRNGGVTEPLDILSKIDPSKAPEALLYESFCHFNRWEHAQAARVLEKYLEQNISNYQRLVGQVNHAAALTGCGDHGRAEIAVAEALRNTSSGGFSRLQGNCLELKAQIRLMNGDISGSKASLEEARKLLADSTAVDFFFVEKWLSIATAIETSSVAPLVRLRKEALARQDWESVREADRFSLRIDFDEALFDHLVFGTPFPAYREKLFEELGRGVGKTHYDYGTANGKVFDLETSDLAGKCAQLIDVLSRDFYRPRRIGALFAEIYPGEYFDIFSSPIRVHQLLRRTRRILETREIPIAIKEEAETYKLAFEGAIKFRVPLERRSVEGYYLEFAKLERAFAPGTSFSAQEARDKLGLPRTSFQRVCTWALERGYLSRSGQGPATRYSLVNTVNTKLAA